MIGRRSRRTRALSHALILSALLAVTAVLVAATATLLISFQPLGWPNALVLFAVVFTVVIFAHRVGGEI